MRVLLLSRSLLWLPNQDVWSWLKGLARLVASGVLKITAAGVENPMAVAELRVPIRVIMVATI